VISALVDDDGLFEVLTPVPLLRGTKGDENASRNEVGSVRLNYIHVY